MALQFLVHFTAQFISKQSDKPLSGEAYITRLYDADLVDDDLLATAIPDEQGKVTFTVDPAHFRDWDNIIEKFPDLYIEIEKDGAVIFKTPVAKNTDIRQLGNFSVSTGAVLDLGTFLI